MMKTGAIPMRPLRWLAGSGLLFALVLPLTGGAGKDGVKVDKDKRTVTIDAKVAPRKLEHLKGEIYPIEVIACWAHPKGKKAHETVVTIEASPSAVAKGLEELGLKPGTPVMGEKKEPQGPEVKVYLLVDDAGDVRRLTMDKVLLDKNNGKPFPKTIQWRFTGSALTKPDPNKNEEVYGADFTGTLIVIFPVTNATVLQTNLTMEYERFMKLETNTKVLPPVGTPVKLVLEVPATKK
jgi:hypothetical protein